MNQSIYAVYGVSGFGREVIPLARQTLQRLGVRAELVFIDDAKQQSSVNGHSVYSYAEFLALKIDQKYINIAIANSDIREKIAKKIAEDQIESWSVHADNVVLMDNVDFGEGSIVCPFVTLTSDIKIGRYFHANIYSYIAHDCVIGDYVTFAPSVHCNGNIIIEDHAYIGTGAILKQGTPEKPLRIGRGAVVGMGAVVTKDVPAGVTVVGNPAKILEKK